MERQPFAIARARTGAALEVLALGLWSGAMAGFAFLFAPAAFANISDLDVFARVVAAAISHTTTFGFVCAVVALGGIAAQGRGRYLRARIACIALATIGGAVETSAVMPAMSATLAHAGGSFHTLAPSAPARVAYDKLHHLSSLVYGTALLAVLAAIVLRAIDLGGRANPEDAARKF